MANILDYIAMFQPSPKQVQDKLSQAIEASWETSPSGLMPLRRNKLTGQEEWIIPPALQALFSGVTAPARALSGELPAYAEDANGKVTLNPQMVDDAAALAGTMTLGAGAMPKPSNALGMGGGKMAKAGSDAKAEWFGDSKVVDEKGLPLVVYKGAPPNWGGPAEGKFAGFFSDDPAVASYFARAIAPGDQAVTPAYLKIERPFEIDAGGKPAASVQFDDKRQGWDGAAFRAAMKNDAYDGIIIRNTSDEGTIYVTKRDVQAKSPFNRGTYDPNDPNILHSGGSPIPALAGAGGGKKSTKYRTGGGF